MTEKVELFWETIKIGEVDSATFELVKMYLSDGKDVKEILQELKKCGLTTSLAIQTVLNARRHLREIDLYNERQARLHHL